MGGRGSRFFPQAQEPTSPPTLNPDSCATGATFVVFGTVGVPLPSARFGPFLTSMCPGSACLMIAAATRRSVDVPVDCGGRAAAPSPSGSGSKPLTADANSKALLPLDPRCQHWGQEADPWICPDGTPSGGGGRAGLLPPPRHTRGAVRAGVLGSLGPPRTLCTGSVSGCEAGVKARDGGALRRPPPDICCLTQPGEGAETKAACWRRLG